MLDFNLNVYRAFKAIAWWLSTGRTLYPQKIYENYAFYIFLNSTIDFIEEIFQEKVIHS